MTPKSLADLHAVVFETPQPWSEAAFEKLLKQPNISLFTAPHGFALISQNDYEIELLTIAVDPKHHRTGLASQLMDDIMNMAADRPLILEVAADNHAAIALYRKFGLSEIARRPRYYRTPTGSRIDAIVMKSS